jgi:hypothetical protein
MVTRNNGAKFLDATGESERIAGVSMLDVSASLSEQALLPVSHALSHVLKYLICGHSPDV